MSTSTVTTLLCLVLALCASDAMAGKRAIRVDGFGDTWTTFDGQPGNGAGVGSANCPGTTAGLSAADTLVQRIGHTFSGRQNTAFLIDDYCQVANSGTLTTQGYTYPDETGLARLFGSNPGNLITGIRYQMLDQQRFNAPTAFQWAFYSFPTGITIVGLYGFENTTLDGSTFISNVFSGVNPYTGQYFCFNGSTSIGTWDGVDPNAACPKAALNRIFVGGFDP